MEFRKIIHLLSKIIYLLFSHYIVVVNVTIYLQLLSLYDVELDISKVTNHLKKVITIILSNNDVHVFLLKLLIKILKKYVEICNEKSIYFSKFIMLIS